jgi:superoxide reductase
MAQNISEKIRTADWKGEKHVPVIDCPDEFKSGENTLIKISVGKEISHPNTTEHHIRWIRVYYVPDGGNYAYDVGNFEFNAHGESTDGPNLGPIFTHHKVKFEVMLKKNGTINAISYCNIHGLWESSKKIQII